jgi:hypothetical protein
VGGSYGKPQKTIFVLRISANGLIIRRFLEHFCKKSGRKKLKCGNPKNQDLNYLFGKEKKEE